MFLNLTHSSSLVRLKENNVEVSLFKQNEIILGVSSNASDAYLLAQYKWIRGGVSYGRSYDTSATNPFVLRQTIVKYFIKAMQIRCFTIPWQGVMLTLDFCEVVSKRKETGQDFTCCCAPPNHKSRGFEGGERKKSNLGAVSCNSK